MDRLSESYRSHQYIDVPDSSYIQHNVESVADTTFSRLSLGASQSMVRDTGTSMSYSQESSGGTNQNMNRRSFDMSSNTLDDLSMNEQRSLSDSELDMISYTVPDLMSEFLDLPARISFKTQSSLRHRIDPEKLYLDLQKVKLEQLRHAETNKTSQCTAPKIEFTPVDVIVCAADDNDGNKQSDIYMDSDITQHYDSDYSSRTCTNMWINLDPPTHKLLSPRSSNGSISSYRSSNADSAIEVLTPDEEMSEHSPIDLTGARPWDVKQKYPPEKLPENWRNSDIGATLHSKVVDSTQQDSSFHLCSQPLYNNYSLSSHSDMNSPCDLNPFITQQLNSNSNAANAPPAEKSNKGGELLVTRPPSVIVSDFSSEGSYDASTPLINTSSTQGSLLLSEPSDRFHRSLSNSSISSTDSFLSLQSESSTEVDDSQEFPIKVAKKDLLNISNTLFTNKYTGIKSSLPYITVL
ncbi:hypothetical protein ACF0H5_002433 [Mactra antiquata]